jgi:catechol 2,3-dioxygenase-like lactoylglutathione lyase family enzyme
MIEGIFSVAVLVKDAERAAEWYRDKLGFEVMKDGHWVTCRPPGSKVQFHLCEPCKEWGDDAPGGNTGIALLCDDVERTYRELKSKGVEFAKELTRGKSGAYAVFKDLDGNEFWI